MGLISIFLILICYAVIPKIVFAEPDLVDSYSETNQNIAFTIKGTHPSSNSDVSATGQSFTNTDTSKDITSVKFYLKKIGSPTGNINAVLYAHSGIYGSSSLPTGNALATSDGFEIGDVTGDFTLITFTFSGEEQYEMLADTYYCIVFQEESVTWSGGYIHFGIDTTEPSHDGNLNYYINGAWDGSNSYDGCFYVYGETALDVMEKEFTDRKTFIDSEVDRISKERFKGNREPQQSDRPAEKTMKRSDFDVMDSKARNDFMKSGGVTID